MAIKTVVTRGFGNGTFSGTVPLVTLRGYSVGAVPSSPASFSGHVRIRPLLDGQVGLRESLSGQVGLKVYSDGQAMIR